MALFEATFAAICKKAFAERRALAGEIDKDEVVALSEDRQFLDAAIEGTTRTVNVEMGLHRAETLLTACEMAVVDTIYTEFKDAVSVLAAARELSLQITLESNLRKTLLLSAASYF